MLNYLWAFMILIGIIYGGVTGKMDSVTNGALNSVGDAVNLCITMLGIMALWCGIMEIAKKAGIIASATKRLQPLIKILFPDIPNGHPALEYITTNIIANFTVIIGLSKPKIFWVCLVHLLSFYLYPFGRIGNFHR